MAKVYSSIVIPAPASAVWAIVRDFNGLPNWTKFVVESRIEHNAPADKVGCIRNFRLANGGRIRERLLALSNDVGLLAEEYDPVGHRQLGNFPQAFSHLALINSALNLDSHAGPAVQRSQGDD